MSIYQELLATMFRVARRAIIFVNFLGSNSCNQSDANNSKLHI